LKKIFKPTDSPVWEELAAHRQSLENISLKQLFSINSNRFNELHTSGAGLILDYSKNLITQETVGLLVKAAKSVQLQDKIDALFNGDYVNSTETRPALHTALRDSSGSAPYHAEISNVMEKMTDIVQQVHAGHWKGATDKNITDIVNIGIGGSHLGPMMVTNALQSYSVSNITCHFVSNLDSVDIYSVLNNIEADSTLFIICSKSFTTLETLKNAQTARAWLKSKLPIEAKDYGRHFLAITAHTEKATEFGIPEENVLPMWDWVGGRYSLWSAIGISIALSIGMDNFNELRKGAEQLDQHFRRTSFEKNLPVLSALLEIWYVNYWECQSHAVLPYVHNLRFLPEFLQQLEMESNGKSVNVDNNSVCYQTAPVIWGTVGTNGQHSFHQLLHQGTQFIPIDFIFELNPELDDHHNHLVANCLAQSNALMNGISYDEIKQELINTGIAEVDAHEKAMHRHMSGNRPSNTIVFDRLSPQKLGALIAHYEHKVFVQSVIWNINAFDQFGVELGKMISLQVYETLTGDKTETKFDSSTEGLISLYKSAIK
jgi:glucose-6-phosphate isomerase